MHPIDLLLIAVYILGVTAFGAWIGASSRGLKGYFLGGSTVPGWAIMLSIVATETSTITFLSVPTLAFEAGGDFAYLQLAIGYILARIVVAVVLLPGYFKGELYTAYQVLAQRFGGATKSTASVLFLGSRTLGDGLRLYLSALVLRELLRLGGVVGDGSSAWVSDANAMPLAIVIMGISTIVYTFLGGMTAVVWTDVTQFIIYILGAVVALCLMVNGIDGGWSELFQQGARAHKFRMFVPRFDLTETYTLWAGVLGGMVVGTATHGADQLMVQRYLSARSQRQAGAALIASGFVVFLQFALFLLIGVGLFVFFGQHPPARELGTDEAFAYFLVNWMPTGLLGLIVAAIFSAAMSTLSSSLNASASSTVNDLIRPRFPNLPEARLLRISKGLTIVWGLAQMSVAYVAATWFQDSPVINNALSIASFVTGIILGVFLLGVWASGVDQRSALMGMVAGFLVVSYVHFAPIFPKTLLYPFDRGLAWPYYAFVGSGTTYAVGWLSSRLPGKRARPSPVPDPNV